MSKRKPDTRTLKAVREAYVANDIRDALELLHENGYDVLNEDNALRLLCSAGYKVYRDELPVEMQLTFSLADLQKRWGIKDDHTLPNLIKSGELPAFKVGKMWRVRAEVVDNIERKDSLTPCKRPRGAGSPR